MLTFNISTVTNLKYPHYLLIKESLNKEIRLTFTSTLYKILLTKLRKIYINLLTPIFKTTN
jgi:hypothetical protein